MEKTLAYIQELTDDHMKQKVWKLFIVVIKHRPKLSEYLVESWLVMQYAWLVTWETDQIRWFRTKHSFITSLVQNLNHFLTPYLWDVHSSLTLTYSYLFSVKTWLLPLHNSKYNYSCTVYRKVRKDRHPSPGGWSGIIGVWPSTLCQDL